jgi:hypothetical protein
VPTSALPPFRYLTLLSLPDAGVHDNVCFQQNKMGSDILFCNTETGVHGAAVLVQLGRIELLSKLNPLGAISVKTIGLEVQNMSRNGRVSMVCDHQAIDRPLHDGTLLQQHKRTFPQNDQPQRI